MQDGARRTNFFRLFSSSKWFLFARRREEEENFTSRRDVPRRSIACRRRGNLFERAYIIRTREREIQRTNKNEDDYRFDARYRWKLAFSVACAHGRSRLLEMTRICWNLRRAWRKLQSLVARFARYSGFTIRDAIQNALDTFRLTNLHCLPPLSPRAILAALCRRKFVFSPFERGNRPGQGKARVRWKTRNIRGDSESRSSVTAGWKKWFLVSEGRQWKQDGRRRARGWIFT